MKHIVTGDQMDSLAGAIHEQGKELSDLRKDAERYRFLRKYWVDSYLACGKEERLDAEIDEAMK
jgi:hypothetical protein